jgi:hypothetical protein
LTHSPYAPPSAPLGVPPRNAWAAPRIALLNGVPVVALVVFGAFFAFDGGGPVSAPAVVVAIVAAALLCTPFLVGMAAARYGTPGWLRVCLASNVLFVAVVGLAFGRKLLDGDLLNLAQTAITFVPACANILYCARGVLRRGR